MRRGRLKGLSFTLLMGRKGGGLSDDFAVGNGLYFLMLGLLLV